MPPDLRNFPTLTHQRQVHLIHNSRNRDGQGAKRPTQHAHSFWRGLRSWDKSGGSLMKKRVGLFRRLRSGLRYISQSGNHKFHNLQLYCTWMTNSNSRKKTLSPSSYQKVQNPRSTITMAQRIIMKMDRATNHEGPHVKQQLDPVLQDRFRPSLVVFFMVFLLCTNR
jgi:hypothetical protein